MNNTIREKLKQMPLKSGVYIMKDEKGQVIYVGKAKRLKVRVSSYFNKSTKPAKVLSMVEHIADLDYFVCASEYDALALEGNLIKQYQPFYNILLKDGKMYPYIRINTTDDFGKVELVRKVKKDGNKYFGPFLGGVNVHEVIELINGAFCLPNCGIKLVENKHKRACINKQLGLCVAPCDGSVSKKEYAAILAKVIAFLNGDDKEIEFNLRAKMMAAASTQNFELAIKMRNYLKTLDKLKGKIVSQTPTLLDADIFAVVSDGINCAIATCILRGGKMIGVATESVECMSEGTLASFIVNYYEDNNLPKLVLTNEPIDSSITEHICLNKHKKSEFICPQKGLKRDLLEMAIRNAKQHFIKSNDRATVEYNKTIGALKELQKELLLPQLPRRIECYDISHTGGTYKTGSMVVFVDGVSKKSHYRKFIIKEVEGNNDFESMKEVLRRRFSELAKGSQDVSFSELPDLIVIDGGKGQLSSVIEILSQTASDYLNKINVVGLAKRLEEVFTPNNNIPIVIDHNHESLKLLQRVRDEAHRFAITFHRSLRGKGMVKSILDGIKGIGKVKKENIQRAFPTLDALNSATIEDFAKIDAITMADAQAIYNKVHNL